MNFQERKQIILKTVENKGSIEVKQLAELVRTSEITIRRDLAILAEKGLIYRTHGGAMRVELAKESFTFANKSAVKAEQKDYICQLAAQKIQDGDVIFLDCGSTLVRLCPLIKHKRIKVITNSLPIVSELINSQVSINFIGGEIDIERQAVHGTIALEHIARYQATKAFIGVDGISVEKGLSAFSEKEACTALAMAKNAEQVFLLCDSSKLEQNKYFYFAPLTLVHVLITDYKAPKELIEQYRKAGLEVLS